MFFTIALAVAVIVLGLRGVLDVTGDSNSQDLDLVLYVTALVLAVASLFPTFQRRV